MQKPVQSNEDPVDSWKNSEENLEDSRWFRRYHRRPTSLLIDIIQRLFKVRISTLTKEVTEEKRTAEYHWKDKVKGYTRKEIGISIFDHSYEVVNIFTVGGSDWLWVVLVKFNPDMRGYDCFEVLLHYVI